MKIKIPEKTEKIARLSDSPLYVVGGAVRNAYLGLERPFDLDLAGNIPTEKFIDMLERAGLSVTAEYKRTGTVMFFDEGVKCEYTRFRTDSYAVGGGHNPKEVRFTDDIKEDALRRDFKCNAVYYDVKSGEKVDPLCGVSDIEKRVLDTVDDTEKVFSHDGLRLMRLARFSGELGFIPEKDLLAAAKEYAANIKDVSAERIFAELKAILKADKKYPFSDRKGHYTGLKILSETRVLDMIMPELTLGRGMPQRSDFHDYDVLEHSLRTALYAPENVRLPALLHDCGKPYCLQNYGKYHLHNVEGKRIAHEILTRLKADKKSINECLFIAEYHMLDLKCDMRESKIVRFIVDNYKNIEDLLAVKQADYSACKDDLSVAPTVKRWREIMRRMEERKVPIKMSDLKISGNDLRSMGVSGEKVGKVLKTLFYRCVAHPENNTRKKLTSAAKRIVADIDK